MTFWVALQKKVFYIISTVFFVLVKFYSVVINVTNKISNNQL